MSVQDTQQVYASILIRKAQVCVSSSLRKAFKVSFCVSACIRKVRFALPPSYAKSVLRIRLHPKSSSLRFCLHTQSILCASVFTCKTQFACQSSQTKSCHNTQSSSLCFTFKTQSRSLRFSLHTQSSYLRPLLDTQRSTLRKLNT
ncbi:hypothetical protein L6452_38794 [Arctium lappa]|uniref:Uncharacterized protein n=1 Tax=Arctium lappa TaxID=4217 RepID=A0ACB8XQ11_ARCLA|nr:hypothetical protein L6452_38794 [Arctium lappa]